MQNAEKLLKLRCQELRAKIEAAPDADETFALSSGGGTACELACQALAEAQVTKILACGPGA